MLILKVGGPKLVIPQHHLVASPTLQFNTHTHIICQQIKRSKVLSILNLVSNSYLSVSTFHCFAILVKP